MIQSLPNLTFLFGNSLDGRSILGQAATCNGLPNCVGIPTRIDKCNKPESHWTDITFKAYGKKALDEIFDDIISRGLPTVALPKIGHGFSMLYHMAPTMYVYMYNWLCDHDCQIPRRTSDGRLIYAYPIRSPA